MWSYYGSKGKVVKYYPKPKHGKIIEPFAGTARYALRYFENDVLLVDKYEVIVRIWKWLQQCSEKDILSLPILKEGQNLKDFKGTLSEEELLFLRFNIGCSVGEMVWKYSKMQNEYKQKKYLRYIAKNLFKIKHFKIIHGDYTETKNQKATWFIDPPYQFGGNKYYISNKHIDFNSLASWCESREGQVIVCENTKADWMDFKPMIEMQGTLNRTTEAIWTNQKTSIGVKQLKLAI